MRGIGAWTLAGVLVTACGDDEEKSRDEEQPSAEELRQMAVQKCNDLIDTFCERVVGCAEDEDLIDERYPATELNTECKAAIGEVLPCESAVDVGKSYAKCLSDVEKFSCELSNDALLATPAAFAGPPPSCTMQILFPPD
jgi:hypothetical protein